MTLPNAKALAKGIMWGLAICAWFVWLFSMYIQPIAHISSSPPQPTVLTTAIYPDRVCVVFLTADNQVLTKCATTTQ